MPFTDWQKFQLHEVGLESTELPSGKNHENFFNSVYLPTLLSPIALVSGLWGLRAATLVAGLIGLFYLFRLCRRCSDQYSAVLGVAVAGLTIPLLPYLHLFYMETYIFTLICCGWERLQKRDRPIGGDLITAIVLLAIPFVHLRASFIAAALYLLLLYQLYSDGKTKRALVFVALAAASLLTLLALNQTIYGSISGPIVGKLPPPSQWFSYFSMQLFNLHHGLFAYAPVWLLGIAGLLSGTARGSTLVRQGLVLAAIAAATSVGRDAGESWPARYWIPLIPMLAVGFSAWWDVARRPLPRLVAMLLIGFTLANTFMFFRVPNDFLENRASTKTYQTLFDKFGHLNFGVVLPVVANDEPNLAAAQNLAILSGVFILLLVMAARRRHSVYAVLSLLLIAAAADLARVSVLKPTDYTSELEPGRLRVNFDTPVKAVYVQFGDYRIPWYNLTEGQRFALSSVSSDGRQFHADLAANQVVGASCRGSIKSVTIESPPAGGVDIGSEASHKLVVYRSKSLLRKNLSFLRKPC